VVDLAFDYELARNWDQYSNIELSRFDSEVRDILERHDEYLAPRLREFMAYADQRGLFEAYRHEEEMLYSLAGLGTRLKRANPLHRVGEIWPEIKADIHLAFELAFPEIQSEVLAWRKRRSTTTGS
jgi:acyl carrier protein phosphodiesterase